MQVSVIIAVYNRASLLPDLLEQWKQIDKVTKYKYELIFSDDESSDNSVEILKACSDLPMKVLTNKHGGASKARNHAYQHSTGEIIIFTGDDIFPTLNFVNEHYEAYLKHGSMYASLGCIDWREGIKMNHLMKHITDIGCEQFGFVGMRPFEIVDFRHFYTSNISVARERLEELDCLFSLEFKKYGFEDIDLGYRLYKKGLQIIYNPNALAYHDHVYDSVEKFCKRQASAGEELNTFKRLHPALSEQEIKFNIDEFHMRYNDYISSKKTIDIVGDAGRVLIYLMMQLTKMIELMLKKYPYASLKKVCSRFYSIIFSYYMHLGLAYGYEQGKNVSQYKAQRFTFRYLFFGKAQIFFDTSNQFTELNAATFHTAGAKNITLKVDIPNSLLGRIRFDALDSFCKVKIKRAIANLSDGTQADIHFEYSNAKSETNKQYNFSNQIDPVIISDVLPRSTQSVEVKYQINYLLMKRLTNKLHLVKRLIKKVVKKVVGKNRHHVPTSIPNTIANNEYVKQKVWLKIVNITQADIHELVDEYSFACSHLLDLKIDIVSSSSPEYKEYIYEITDLNYALEKSQFLNVMICLLKYDYDFVVLSDGLSQAPKVHTHSLRDSLFLSKKLGGYTDFITSELPAYGKLICIPGSKRTENIIDITSIIPSLKVLDHNILYLKNERKLILNNSLEIRTKEKRKPIVLVLPVFMAVGGVERNTIEVMGRLKDEYDFVVATFESHRLEQGSLFYQVAQMEIDYYDFYEISSFDNYNHLLKDLKNLYNPDLLWLCNSSPWMVENSSELRKIFSNAPIVVQDVYDYKYGWIEYYDRPSIHAYDRFIAINKKIEEKFIQTYGIKAEDIDLVYPAADTDKVSTLSTGNYSRKHILQSLNLDPQKIHFAFIGRFTEQKQPLKMLELAKYIVGKHHNIDFVMVGDGELSSAVEDKIKHEQLEDRVHRIKYISDVFQFVKSIDGLFIASIYEGLPIVTIEAMCVGTPIFATDVGDIALFVNEQQSGLVSNTDDLESLKKGFDIFYANIEQYKQNSLDHTSENIEFFSSQRAAELMRQSFYKALDKYQ